MKKTTFLITLLLSFTVISAGCSDTSKEETEAADVEEITEKEVETTKEEPEVKPKEEINSTNWFDTTRDLDAYYYEVSADLTDGPSYITKVWSAENKIKMESTYPENSETIIMIMDEEDDLMYMYMPEENTAMMMKYGDNGAFTSENEQQGAQDYVEIMKELADEEITIEDGTFEGEAVKIVTGEIDGNINKIWISDDTGFPLKSEFYMDDELESSTTFTTFEETSIDPSIFELPEDVIIQDLTNF